MRFHPAITTVIILAVIFGGSFLLYQERSALYAEANALALIPRPERFTELSFNDAATLPRAIVAHQPISFAFTIHNVEAVTTTYPYEVYFKYPNGGHVDLATGTVTLASDASTAIIVSHTFTTSNLTGSVVVNLPALGNQQIDFLVPNQN